MSRPAVRVAVIVNPCAGHGKAGRLAPKIIQALHDLGSSPTVYWTERPRHASDLARRAVEDGATVLATLGGDGTLNEVISGLLSDGPWPPDVAVAPIPVGTANSFTRDFGILNGQWQESLQRLHAGKRRSIDAARVTYRDADGTARTAYSVNVFGVGFMALVADATNRQFKALGSFGYSAAVFWQLARLSVSPTHLELRRSGTGDETEETQVCQLPLILAAVCNSQWTGDRMWIAPQADPSDGVLDVLTLGAVSRLELVRLFLRLFRGAHLSHPAVNVFRAQEVAITPSTPSPLLIDGEVFGSTPVIITVVPAAVTVAL